MMRRRSMMNRIVRRLCRTTRTAITKMGTLFNLLNRIPLTPLIMTEIVVDWGREDDDDEYEG